MGSSAEDIVERRTGILRLATGYNVRELCGYKTPWGLTLPHRFLRSGDTNELSEGDAGLLRAYGVTMDVDLRSEFEVTRAPDVFADDPRVRYHNASLYSVNMHDSDLAEGDGMDDYLVGGYLAMLSNREAVRQVFSFMATAEPSDCVLFHCAAGMDRTGVTSMLLLGLCRVSEHDILRDYLLSFASVDLVEDALRGERGASRPPHARQRHAHGAQEAGRGTARSRATWPAAAHVAHARPGQAPPGVVARRAGPSRGRGGGCATVVTSHRIPARAPMAGRRATPAIRRQTWHKSSFPTSSSASCALSRSTPSQTPRTRRRPPRPPASTRWPPTWETSSAPWACGTYG